LQVSPRTKIQLCFVLAMCVSGISWLYVHRILDPWVGHIRLGKGLRIAQVSDLYSPWVGTRELLLHRRNPYGPDVSHEIQLVYYGHVINQTYGKPGVELADEQRFAYPIYEVFLMAPFVYTDFAKVQRWAPFVLGLIIALNVFVALSLVGWRPRWEALAAIILFTLASPQIAQGLRLEQLAIVEGCLLTASALCVSRKHLAASGALLALSTIKPQMALLPLCWFAIWAAGDYRKRWRLPAGFIATLAGLIAAGELLLPRWPGYFLAGLAAYRKYALPTSLLRVALGDTAGDIVGGVVLVGILALGWRNRKEPGDSRRFVSTLVWFFMAALFAFPLFTPFNQVLLILPAILLLQDWNALSKFSRLVFLVIVGWPGFFSLMLLFFPPHVDSPSQLPLLPSFLVPFVPLLLLLLLLTRCSQAREPGFPELTVRPD
jgi:hypothetical protein